MRRLNYQKSNNGSILVMTMGLLFLLLSVVYVMKESVVDKYKSSKLIDEYYDSRIMEELFLQEFKKKLALEPVGKTGTIEYNIGKISYEIRPQVLYYRMYLDYSKKIEVKQIIFRSS